MIRIFVSVFIACLFFVTIPTISVSARPESGGTVSATKLLRFPDICEEAIVFCHGGDLWKVAREGGTATRLTAHPGQELFPKFSPDGSMIAFTGQYDGDEQVYVIPAQGGVPKQLTFYPARGPLPPRHGYDHIVYGWTPDGKRVLFRSLRDANSVTQTGTLYTVALEGGLPEKVGVPTSGAADFSPDGNQLVYSPLFRDFRTWKRYQGGWAQYLLIQDLKTGKTTRLDQNPRTEREPVWIDDKIYFTSDRTGTMNLFEYDVQTEKIVQCTDQQQWDVRWASGDKQSGRIVFELGGELVVYQTRAGQREERFQKPVIHVPHDALARRPSRIPVAEYLEAYQPGPDGRRVAVIARGDLFVLPVEQGYVRNLSESSSAHERDPVWNPTGKSVAVISDQGGEDHIRLFDVTSEKSSSALTSPLGGQLDHLQFSPCGRYLAFCDNKSCLFVTALEEIGSYKKAVPVRVVSDRHGGRPEAVFSPCGNFLAYTLRNAEGLDSIHLFDLTTQQHMPVTSPLFDAGSPAWDPGGKFLYFIAQREFAPQLSNVEWNFAGNRNQGIYALVLAKDTPNPFGPRFEDDPKEDEKKKDVSTDASSSKPGEKTLPDPTRIDTDDMKSRIVKVPVPFENYANLSATENYLLYTRYDPSFYGREPERKPRLMLFDLKKRKESVLIEELDSYSIAPDGKRIAYKKGKSLKTCSVALDAKSTDLKTEDMYAEIVPAEEWAEIFREVWRKFRDFFYVENMHGYDWNALGRQYSELLPHVAHRSDLNYLIGEMIAELNVGHAYIQGGDFHQPTRPKVALPGCRFELDRTTDRYRIAKIYRGDPSEPKYRAPLATQGSMAREGDFVLKIDSIELTGKDNPYKILRNRTNPVTLTLHSAPTLDGARTVVFEPVFSEQELIYHDFVQQCREQVDRETGGRAGYLHIPDMGADGAYEFIKWYYPQIRKEGLVIDVRANGGGNISRWLITRLNQPLLGTRFGGVKESPGTYPDTARFGHQVCLINETSASDGDIFPYYFRKTGLGPLIGKRTWGGVVGISPRGRLLDGGLTYVPLMATNDEFGNWIIEGEGVTPDIEVENDPISISRGKDPQLEKAIAELLKQMNENPIVWPQRPADPDKK